MADASVVPKSLAPVISGRYSSKLQHHPENESSRARARASDVAGDWVAPLELELLHDVAGLNRDVEQLRGHVHAGIDVQIQHDVHANLER